MTPADHDHDTGHAYGTPRSSGWCARCSEWTEAWHADWCQLCPACGDIEADRYEARLFIATALQATLDELAGQSERTNDK